MKTKTIDPIRDASDRFQEAYEKYAPDLRAYFSICFGDSMAEDLTQQLFLKLWVYLLGRPGFVPENWRAWLFRGAVNLKNDTIRWVRTLPQPFALDEDEDALPSPARISDDTDERLRRIAVRAALFRMDTRERDLILLKYMGFHSGEIGELLHLSASAVRSRFARARDHFEKFLREAGGHWEG